MEEWNRNRLVFPNSDCTGYPYCHIHPYKQDAVQYFVENKPEWITHVIVFGSAVTTAHLWYSDLDICVIGERDAANLSYRRAKLDTVNYDIVWRSSIDHLRDSAQRNYPVYRDILQKGVLVFGKI